MEDKSREESTEEIKQQERSSYPENGLSAN